MIYFLLIVFLFSSLDNSKIIDAGKKVVKEEKKVPVEIKKETIDKKVQIKQEVENEKDKDNLGIKKVIEIINTCSDIKALDEAKDDNKISLIEYNKKKDTLYTKMSANFDYFKVAKDSLQYDFDPITKKYKKHHWTGKSEKSENEKSRFVNTFTDVVSSIVYPICANFFGENRVAHKVVSSTDNKIHIESKVFMKKKYALAEWFIAKSNNVWKIYDVSIEEESWVASFRSQFTELIEEKSYNELIKVMEDRKKEVLDKRRNKKEKKPENNQALKKTEALNIEHKN